MHWMAFLLICTALGPMDQVSKDEASKDDDLLIRAGQRI
jgi:hypothetical protein